MSITITVTETSTIINHEAETPRRRLSTQEAFDNLLEIFERYDKWNDPLSAKIYSWGSKVIEDFGNRVINQEVEAEARARIRTLKTEILVDSLYKRTLVDPKLDRVWVYEASFLNRYQRQFVQSPFDGETITARTHDFAKDMIAWVNSLPSEANQKEDSVGDTHSFSTSLTTQELISTAELIGIIHTAQTRIAVEKSHQQGIAAEKAKAEAVRIEVETKAHVEQEVKRAQELADEHETRLDERISGIEAAQQERVNILQGRNAECNQKLNTAQGQISQLQQASSSQMTEIQRLRQLYNQKQREVNDLRNSDQDHGFCVIQ